jgi:D-aspartate ligase
VSTPRARLERWIGQHADGPPVTIVFGASPNGLSFLRSLGRRGVPVLLIDADPLVASFSRYAMSISIPRGAGEDDAVTGLLERLGQRLRTPGVIFSTADHYCLLLARHEAALARHFRFLQPDLSTIESIIDKSAQYRRAEAAGIPIPPTFYPTTAQDLEAVATQVRFPAILKPYQPDHRPAAMREKSIKVMHAHSAADLRAGFERATALGFQVMVQEVIPGDDSHFFGYWGFWDSDGRERAWVTKRKLRQSPPGFGDGSMQETIDAPDVAESSRALMRAFNYRGFVGVEFKRDPRDGRLLLIEINPRTESGNQLAISAGVDFPWIGYQYLTDQLAHVEGPLAPSFTPGVVFVNEEWDLKAFLALRSDGTLTLPDWVRSLRSVRSHALGAWDDPLPALVIAGRIARAAARRTLRLAR